jgi:hypothetical protein
MTPQTFMLCCWGYGKIVMWCGGFRGGEVCVVDEIWKKKKERKKKKQEFNLGWFGGLIRSPGGVMVFFQQFKLVGDGRSR